MLSEAELRNRVAEFVAGDLSLDDFEDWFAGASWNSHQHASQELQRLVGLVEIYLAEHSNVHRNEQQLRAALRSLLIFPQPAGNALQPVVEVYLNSHVRGVGDIVRFASNVPVNSIAAFAPANSAAGDEPEFEVSIPR